MGPASHPIRGDVPDVSQAMANFDAISYQKGQAVLKQLSAYVGEEAFLAGCRPTSATMPGATPVWRTSPCRGGAAGEDLSDLGGAWLDRAGTDTLSLEGGTLTATGPTATARVRTASTSAATPRTVTAGSGTSPTSPSAPKAPRPR
jgi:aminopeptidase N